MHSFDLSMIVFAHDEGRLLHLTITACDRAVAYAEARGWTVERVLVLLDPTPSTGDWASEMLPRTWSSMTVRERDLGQCRNAAVRACRGSSVAFLDGGDAFDEGWLHRALSAAKYGGGDEVWHPELTLTFGDMASKRFQPDRATEENGFAGLIDANPYSSCILARRHLFERLPFVSTDLARGLGYPDWHWACDVAAAGYQHRIVPDTWHYIRHGSTFFERLHPGARCRIGFLALLDRAANAAVHSGTRAAAGAER